MSSVNDITRKTSLRFCGMDDVGVEGIQTHSKFNVHRLNSFRKDNTKYECSDGS